MTPLEKAADRRKRQGAKRLRDWYRSLMDCGEPGKCGDECRVCRHFAFEEWVSQVRPNGISCTITWDMDAVRYIKRNKII